MSTSFEARFTRSEIALPQLLAGLEDALPTCGLRFGGTVFELCPDRGGAWPTVAGLEPQQVETLTGALDVGSRWWGLGIEVVSDFLLEGLGRTTAVEVYISVFRCAPTAWTMTYSESSVATDYRARSDDGGHNLIALQQALCKAGGFELSIYAEEDHEAHDEAVVTLREAEVAIKRVVATPDAGDLSVVASSKVIPFERARKLAGARADLVKVMTGGYVAFPFLAPAS